MNCWEILGIDPTRDRAAIDEAYERQKKFATEEELGKLQQAYREASGQSPGEGPSERPTEDSAGPSSIANTPQETNELSAEDQQIVREVVIQTKALLNDSRRSADEGIWKAILTEPPADKPALRHAVGQALEPQIRPMADNGSFPPSVVAFLGDWFGWDELQDRGDVALADTDFQPDEHQNKQTSAEEDTQPPMTNFWPAVIGWVVALAVLAAFFDGIFGG